MSCADTELRRTIVRCLTVLSNFFSYIQNYSGDLNSLVALHELYKYINKYYDQVSVWFQQVRTCLLLLPSNQNASKNEQPGSVLFHWHVSLPCHEFALFLLKREGGNH